MDQPAPRGSPPEAGAFRSVPERLAELAAIAPGAVALAAPHRDDLSFRELYILVRRSAAALAARGFVPGDRIATVLEGGPETFAAMLGVMSGATCVPMSTSYTRAELARHFELMRVKGVMLEAGSASPARTLATEMGLALLEIDADPAGPAGSFAIVDATHDVVPTFARPDDCLMVLHTSGTSGRPKVVPVTHAGQCSAIAAVIPKLGLTPADRFLNAMPLNHMHGLGVTLTAILSGGSAICPSNFSAPLFFHLLERLRPTWYSAAPAVHQAVLAELPKHQDVVARRRLRFVRTGSSAMPDRLFADLEAAFDAPVLDGYGMTECPWAVFNDVRAELRRRGSVGRACASEIAILDETGKPVPSGTVGDLVVRGPNVFAGYEGDEDATRAAFHEGWFRTGDVGRLDDDGFLWLVGRRTEFINRGGAKIAPQEVDEALLAHPAVAEAAAFPVADDRLGQDVMAVVVPLPGAGVEETALHRFLSQRLAYYKVPRRILVVDALPRNAIGKVPRGELAARFAPLLAAEPPRSRSGVPPRSLLEQTVAAIWTQVLGTGPVGIHDDFVTRGGDSLRAVQVVGEIRNATGVGVTLAEVFEVGTVAELSSVIAGRAGSPKAVEAAISIRRRIATLEPEVVQQLVSQEREASA